jgi:hypothetical protein
MLHQWIQARPEPTPSHRPQPSDAIYETAKTDRQTMGDSFSGKSWSNCHFKTKLENYGKS